MARPDSLPATRDAWHRIAEHVLAAARYAVTGHVELVLAPGGFRPRRSVRSSLCSRWISTSSSSTEIGSSAGPGSTPWPKPQPSLGSSPALLSQAYRPATPLEPDATLRMAREVARLLADWYQLGAPALAAFAAEAPDDEPAPAQLWPEQFDLAITPRGSTTAPHREEGVDVAINYVGSPGGAEATFTSTSMETPRPGWTRPIRPAWSRSVCCTAPTPSSKSRAPDHEGQPDTLSRCPPLRPRPVPR